MDIWQFLLIMISLAAIVFTLSKMIVTATNKLEEVGARLLERQDAAHNDIVHEIYELKSLVENRLK